MAPAVPTTLSTTTSSRPTIHTLRFANVSLRGAMLQRPIQFVSEVRSRQWRLLDWRRHPMSPVVAPSPRPLKDSRAARTILSTDNVLTTPPPSPPPSNARASHPRHPSVPSRNPVAPTDPGAPCRPDHPCIPSPRSTPPSPTTSHQPLATCPQIVYTIRVSLATHVPMLFAWLALLLSPLLPLIHLVPPAARRFTRPSTRGEPAKPHSPFQAPVPNLRLPLPPPRPSGAAPRRHLPLAPAPCRPVPGSRTLQTRSGKRAKAHARRPGFPSGEAGPAGVCSPKRPLTRPLPARHAAGNQHQVSSPRAPLPAGTHRQPRPPSHPTIPRPRHATSPTSPTSLLPSTSHSSALSPCMFPKPWICQGDSARAGTDRSPLGRERPRESRVVPALTLAQSPNRYRGRQHEPASARQGVWPALPEGTQWRPTRT